MAGTASQLAFPVQGQISWQGKARFYTYRMGHGKADISMAAQAKGFNISDKKISRSFTGFWRPQVAIHTLNLGKVGTWRITEQQSGRRKPQNKTQQKPAFHCEVPIHLFANNHLPGFAVTGLSTVPTAGQTWQYPHGWHGKIR